jgi:hypothetical protein
VANKLYNNLAIASILMVFPFVAGAGAFIGYLCADWLMQSWLIPGWLFVLVIVLGFMSGVLEGWRLLRLAIRLDKESTK